jgi:hypothetical protein
LRIKERSKGHITKHVRLKYFSVGNPVWKAILKERSKGHITKHVRLKYFSVGNPVWKAILSISYKNPKYG